ncbi:MAG: DUF4126 domain-containing protein [Kiloniellales bacterium]|nr:DUF4126 domain-containing protein [Kiloniellales bacterium]
MGIAETIALSMGIAWASGINLYATLATLGILGATGHMVLPEELQILQDPLVIVAAGFMYCVEFFADKVPGVDTGWDVLHSFIRIPAGAILAAQAMGDISPAAEVAALIVGGGLAASTHTLKAGTRVLINTSPEPFTNWFASLGEDVVVVAGLALAWTHPIAFLIALGLFALLMIWLLPKIWRGIRVIFAKLAELFGAKKKSPAVYENQGETQDYFRPEALSSSSPSEPPPLEGPDRK